jgi:tetratricopeptide (TPR) repeat protein
MKRLVKKPRQKRKKSNSQSLNTPKGKLLESIVAALYQTQGVKIQRNVNYPTKDGEDTREIDILLTTNIAGLPVEYAFQCKNEKTPIGVGKISQFVGDLKDIGIPYKYGIFVSVNGFTKGALRRARNEGIRTLVLKGLSEDRLKSEISSAIQHNIFLIPRIENVSVINEISRAEFDYQFFIFTDENKRPVGTIIDLLFNKWINGEISEQLGKHSVEMQIPVNWFQFYKGEPITPMKISAEVSVLAVAITIDGAAENYLLLDAETKTVEKFKTNVTFPAFKEGVVVPLTHITSEAELRDFVEKSENTRLTLKTKLPRLISNNSYYPFSQPVADKVFSKLIKYGSNFNGLTQEKFNDLLFEASKNDIFREGKFNFLGRVVSVIITDNDGELIDLNLISEQGDFDKVISLKDKYFENPSSSFRKMLAWAYEEKSRQLLSKANQTKPRKDSIVEKSFTNIQNSLALEPKSLSSLEQKAHLLFALNRYDEALRSLDSILSKDPNNIELHSYRIQTLLKLEHWNIALKAINKLEKLLKDSADTIEYNRPYNLFCKAEALFGLGKYKQSWTILLDLWLKFPNETIIYAAEKDFVSQIGHKIPTIEGRWLYIEVLYFRSTEFLRLNEFETATEVAKVAFENLNGIKLLDNMTEEPIAVGEMKGELMQSILERITKLLRDRSNKTFADKQIDKICDWFRRTYNEDPLFLKG